MVTSAKAGCNLIYRWISRRSVVSFCVALFSAGLFTTQIYAADTHFVIIEGLGGIQKYTDSFREQVVELLPTCQDTAGDRSRVHVLAGQDATAQAIQTRFEELARILRPDDSVAVYLVGHGSYDGRRYKLNIPGPDISDLQLKQWMNSLLSSRQLIVNTTSSSGGALESLKSPRRIVITATKNGREKNATVFGKYWAEALGAPAADTDKNESISAMEAFRYAEDRVSSYYSDNKQLATEHPRIEGKLASSFVLARLGSVAEMATDPVLKALLSLREALERGIGELRLRKDEMPQEQYLDELQELLLDLADIQERIDQSNPASLEEKPAGDLP